MGKSIELPKQEIVSEWFQCNEKLEATDWENDVLKDASSGLLYSKYSVYHKYQPYSNRIIQDVIM